VLALPKPVDLSTIEIVALLMRRKASRHASAGGHLTLRSVRTDVAIKTVKSTSSSVSCERTSVECQIAYRKDMPANSLTHINELLSEKILAAHEQVMRR
jgi:hypothetical protein